MRGRLDLYAVKDLDGNRRFYPYGEHPATARQRAHLAKLERIRERMPDTPELLQAVAHVRSLLDVFENGEQRAKEAYCAMWVGRKMADELSRAAKAAGPR